MPTVTELRVQFGFTLLELLLVLAIMALGSSAVVFALRDGPAQQLEKEAQRLNAWLEATRVQARTQGLQVQALSSEQGVRISVLPAGALPDKQLMWLHASTIAQGSPLILGPEPLLPAQSWFLSSRSFPAQSLRIGTDGLHPFKVLP